LSRLTQIAPPLTRFVFLGAGIRLGLPSHPASRRRSCLRLGVSTTSSSRGLSPPSDRPCRAYSRAAPLRGTAGPASAPGSAVGRPARRTPGLSSAKTDQPDASSYALDSPCAAYPGGRCSAGTAGCASECYIRVASCLRVTGRSTRHDPLPRAPPHGQTRPARSLYQPKASWRRCAVRLTVRHPPGFWQLPDEAPIRSCPCQAQEEVMTIRLDHWGWTAAQHLAPCVICHQPAILR